MHPGHSALLAGPLEGSLAFEIEERWRPASVPSRLGDKALKNIQEVLLLLEKLKWCPDRYGYCVWVLENPVLTG